MTKRLQYLPILLNSAPIELRALVQGNSYRGDSWAAQVVENLVMMWSHSDVFCDFASPAVDFVSWERFIRTQPTAWKKLVKKAMSGLEFEEHPKDNHMRAMLYECRICSFVA